jgi:hypothetical protein
MDLDDLDPSDIFPGMGFSKKYINEQNASRSRLLLAHKMNRGLGIYDLPDEDDDVDLDLDAPDPSKEFNDYRVYQIMQPMIEK